MSAFDKLKQVVAKSQKQESPRNVALRVTGYATEDGRDLVKGVDLETGEEVAAFLRPLPEDVAKKLRKPRPEVKDFKAEKGEISSILGSLNDEMRKQVARGIHSKTEPDGVIILESAFKDKNAGGALSARWMSSAFKYDGSAQVLSGVMARVNPPVVLDEDSKRVRQTATLMLSDQAQAVSSGGELTAALVEVLSAKNGAAAMVRVSDGVSVSVVELNRGFTKEKDAQGKEVKGADGKPVYIQRTPEEVAAYFVGTDAGKAAVDCAAEGLKVEVIPMLTMAMGSATKAAMTKEGLDPIMQFDRPYRVEAAGKNGFTPSIIVFYPNKGDEGGLHAFTMIKPTLTRAEVLVPEGIPTPNIAVSSPVVKVDHPSVANEELASHDAVGGLPEIADLSDFEADPTPAAFVANEARQVRRSQGMGL